MTPFDQIVAEIKQEFKTFRLVEKEKSIFMKIIFYVSLMFLWNKRFMTDYTTTIIFWIYMPKRLIGTDRAVSILRHERVHMRDCWRTGILPFVISYLLLLPGVVTFRALWEFRGYKESMQVFYETNGIIPNWYLDYIGKQFTSSNYLWMLPFPKYVRRKLEAYRDEIQNTPT